jgi:hypothetical protein
MEHLQEKRTSVAVAFIKRYYWAFLAALVLLLFRQAILSTVLVIFLIGLGVLSTLSTRLFGGSNLGIELVTFVTVVLAFAFGPFTALIAAIAMVFGASVLAGRLFCPITMGRYGTYVAISLLAGVFSGLEVSTAGKVLAVVYNILMWAVYAMVKGFSLAKGSVPVVVNLVLNFFLFSTFAQPLVDALT